MDILKEIIESIPSACGGQLVHGRNAAVDILSDSVTKAYFDGSFLRTAEFRITRAEDSLENVLAALLSDREAIAGLSHAVRVRFGKMNGKYLETGEYSCSLDFSVCYCDGGREESA